MMLSFLIIDLISPIKSASSLLSTPPSLLPLRPHRPKQGSREGKRKIKGNVKKTEAAALRSSQTALRTARRKHEKKGSGNSGLGKCCKIRHIVRLRQMLLRWRMRAAALSSSQRGASDVPAGHVAVCVGSSSRRFVVRASHLNHPVFLQLLRQAEEEFGFSPGRLGPLSLPSCDESLFEDVLRFVSSPRFANCTLDDLPPTPTCCCADAGRWLQVADAMPLLHGHRENY